MSLPAFPMLISDSKNHNSSAVLILRQESGFIHPRRQIYVWCCHVPFQVVILQTSAFLRLHDRNQTSEKAYYSEAMEAGFKHRVGNKDFSSGTVLIIGAGISGTFSHNRALRSRSLTEDLVRNMYCH